MEGEERNKSRQSVSSYDIRSKLKEILNKKLITAKAEELEKIEEELNKLSLEEIDEYSRGFLDSLRNIVGSLRRGDEKDIIHRFLKNRELLKNEIDRLVEFEEGRVLTEYDQGYYDCWITFLKKILRNFIRQERKEQTSN